MKKFKIILALVASFYLTTSCSNDDNNSVTGDHFPSTVSNYWIYGVKSINNTTKTTVTSQDYLTVLSGNQINFNLGVNSGNLANGLMNSLLTIGSLNKTASALSIDGGLKIPIIGFDALTIPLSKAVLYDINAANNANLSTFSGTYTQDIQGFPLTFKYNLTFKKIQNLSSIKVNNITYSNVTATSIKLNMEISTTIKIQNINTTFPILKSKDILVTTSYYGDKVGLLSATSTIDFNLDATTLALLKQLNVTLTIPDSKSTTNIQELSSYVVK
ncbi:MAG: hypothetical protein Q8S44_09665 [Flavobacteriaceae bacterium]|nr:hypothetical protein [Flavobacteriaceae bacterium]